MKKYHERNSYTSTPLFVVLVIFYPKYLKKISKIIFNINKIRKINFLQIVVNNIEIDLSNVTSEFSFLEGYSVVRHDNTGMEFGAYQKGVNEISHYLASQYEIIICNDTAGSHSVQQLLTKGFLAAFLHSLNNSDFPSRVVGSIISNNPRRFSISEKFISRFIRSNIFGLDSDALESIGFCLYSPEIDVFVNEQPDESKFFTDNVNDILQIHIKKWLFSNTGGWYKAKPLDSQNCQFFARKARSILQEKYLSMRLEESSVAFLEPEFSRIQKFLYLTLYIFYRFRTKAGWLATSLKNKLL